MKNTTFVQLMEEKKKTSKFVTSILIGGALGSIAALLFRSSKKSGLMSETTRTKKTFLQRFLGK